MSAARALRRTFMKSGLRQTTCFYCNRPRWCSNRKGVPICNGCTRTHRRQLAAARVSR